MANLLATEWGRKFYQRIREPPSLESERHLEVFHVLAESDDLPNWLFVAARAPGSFDAVDNAKCLEAAATVWDKYSGDMRAGRSKYAWAVAELPQGDVVIYVTPLWLCPADVRKH